MEEKIHKFKVEIILRFPSEVKSYENKVLAKGLLIRECGNNSGAYLKKKYGHLELVDMKDNSFHKVEISGGDYGRGKEILLKENNLYLLSELFSNSHLFSKIGV